MKPLLTITFPVSGRIYQVPTAIIAAHRVDSLAIMNPEQTREQHATATVALFEDDREILRWASQFMRWPKIEPHARLIDVFDRSLEAEFMERGELELTDRIRIPKPLDSNTIMEKPLSMILSSMAMARQTCNVLGLKDENEDRMGCVALVTGSNEIVDGYIAVMSNFSKYLDSHGLLMTDAPPPVEKMN